MQGEFLGGNMPHLMFIGRRGQPFFWSPFENKAGNHNVAVFGKSGSGKSVALLELCAALAGIGARVIVIDDENFGQDLRHGRNHLRVRRAWNLATSRVTTPQFACHGRARC